MARVQYKNKELGIDRSAGFTFPTKCDFTDLNRWYKQARKAIKQIPEIQNESQVFTRKEGYYLFTAVPGEDFVSFVLQDAYDNRAYVIIDRKASPF